MRLFYYLCAPFLFVASAALADTNATLVQPNSTTGSGKTITETDLAGGKRGLDTNIAGAAGVIFDVTSRGHTVFTTTLVVAGGLTASYLTSATCRAVHFQCPGSAANFVRVGGPTVSTVLGAELYPTQEKVFASSANAATFRVGNPNVASITIQVTEERD